MVGEKLLGIPVKSTKLKAVARVGQQWRRSVAQGCSIFWVAVN